MKSTLDPAFRRNGTTLLGPSVDGADGQVLVRGPARLFNWGRIPTKGVRDHFLNEYRSVTGV